MNSSSTFRERKCENAKKVSLIFFLQVATLFYPLRLWPKNLENNWTIIIKSVDKEKKKENNGFKLTSNCCDTSLLIS